VSFFLRKNEFASVKLAYNFVIGIIRAPKSIVNVFTSPPVDPPEYCKCFSKFWYIQFSDPLKKYERGKTLSFQCFQDHNLQLLLKLKHVLVENVTKIIEIFQLSSYNYVYSIFRDFTSILLPRKFTYFF